MLDTESLYEMLTCWTESLGNPSQRKVREGLLEGRLGPYLFPNLLGDGSGDRLCVCD
jgi:hypothetical protein